MKTFEEISAYLKEKNAEYLLRFYDELSCEERNNLLEQIDSIDFELMEKLYNLKDIPPISNKKIEDISYKIFDELSDKEKDDYLKCGERLIKNGKVAVCQMAGGQGTRLGYNGPKGTFLVNLEKPKTIFEIFADKLKETCQKYDVVIPWYIMTSKGNHRETIEFFEKNNFFDYGSENIRFFTQKELPLLDFNGNFIFESETKIFTAANGNGGIYEALHSSGILTELKEKNIEYIGIGNVDNILMDMLEPTFIGMMAETQKEIGVKTVTKVSPDEKVGVVCKLDGKPGVVEYTEISQEMANMRDEKGRLKFGEGYFGFVMFKIELLEKIASDLAYRPASKKNAYINKYGEKVIAECPNTYKFEIFIFDGFEFANDMLVLSVNREKNFAPIKNKEGVDSPETAIKLYNEYYKN